MSKTLITIMPSVNWSRKFYFCWPTETDKVDLRSHRIYPLFSSYRIVCRTGVTESNLARHASQERILKLDS